MKDRDLEALRPEQRHDRAMAARKLAVDAAEILAAICEIEAEIVVIATKLGISAKES